MKKGIYILPNLLTTGNLFCGVLSIIYTVMDGLKLQAYEGNTPPFGFSAWLILLATVFDLLDGMVARLMRATSRFGVEYDSLSDLVSFGMAPALLLYVAVLRYRQEWGIIVTVLFVIAGALRLARYNSLNATEERKHFMGMPIPAAAGLLASYMLLSRWGGFWYGDKGIIFNKVIGWHEENIYFFNKVFVPVFVLMISLLMVSTLEFPSLKVFLKQRLPFTVLVLFVFIVTLAVHQPEIVIFGLLSIYLLGSLAMNGYKWSYGNKVKPRAIHRQPIKPNHEEGTV